ncbi:MAG TPA: D-xylose ABC transporter substrate-binding protein [Bdellovibrionales bacterium]|nr:D-xylose ABC transporter substrate-binding protein [Bdellovibrionales bacterium]
MLKGRILAVLAMAILTLVVQPAGANKKLKIGLSMDTLKEERWQRDRDLFVAKAKAFGAEVAVQAANGNDALQISQAENLLTQGVDILVVVPHNGVAAAAIVAAAHKVGKKVIAYDRMIEKSDVDLYMSFDNVEVGRMQAKYILERAPKGNYMVLGGAPTDHNAKLYRQGHLEILKPKVDKGEVKIVADPWAREWLASEALRHTENVLSKNKDDLQAIIAPNDGTAGGVVAALKQQNLAGKIPVSGQDADLAACQRIVEGTQTMTVYKPIKLLAERAAEVAVSLAKGETVAAKETINNGKKDVPSILIKPVLVDKNNIDQTVIKDGYHSAGDVYKNKKSI